MTKQLNKEQLHSLEKYERFFNQAVGARYCSYPGQAGVDEMLGIWNEVTGEGRKIRPGCSTCIFHLVMDLGTIYLAQKAEADKAAAAAAAKKAEEERKKKEEAEKKAEEERKKAELEAAAAEAAANATAAAEKASALAEGLKPGGNTEGPDWLQHQIDTNTKGVKKGAEKAAKGKGGKTTQAKSEKPAKPKAEGKNGK